MKQGLVEMVFILDRSGSMSNMIDEVISGFNSLIQKQKEINPDTRTTVVLFDNEYSVLYSGIPVSLMPPLTRDTYYARGSTALLDAVGKTIDDVGTRLRFTSEENRPEKVIMVVSTDGEENSSRTYTRETIKNKISTQRDVYKWEFIFTCADASQFAEAAQWVGRQYTYNYVNSQSGYKNLWQGINQAVSFLNNETVAGRGITATTGQINAELKSVIEQDDTYSSTGT